ncbi:MAG: Methionine-tRNA ligase [Parcubacteria group bacterium GW2011_GWF2_43_11]|nr:MAG: Methionine-tRNA ligase [Parcubacteria group bacterium GW2011_GWF2_43_11]
MEKKFYLTTAIYYVNALPHLGHALEKVQADTLARYHRFLGEDVFFLTGTDENSLKNVQAARKEGIPVQKLVDRNSEKFHQLKGILNLSFDDFIRTTEKRHVKGVQKLWQACQKDIYKKTYRGLYCVGCEEFYKESELYNGLCPEHQTKPVLVEEENYFFRLSKYQSQLKDLIEKDKLRIIPQVRKNEVLSFINSGLEDICISRSAERAGNWGVDVSGDDSQKIWVWFDALSNYLNALGYAENSKKFKKYWPADLHIIGKGILRFHAVYWPALLLSASLLLPKEIFIHGYITSNGQKMSKSLGNVVDPFELVKKYGTDAVRYFLLREIPSTEDGDFTEEKFKERYNGDLASGLGNLVSRLIKHPQTPNVPKIEREENLLEEYRDALNIARKQYKYSIEKFEFSEALATIWQLIKFCDQKIEKTKLWEKGGRQVEIIASLLFVISEISELLKPFLPKTSETILKQLETRKSEPLFPRLQRFV